MHHLCDVEWPPGAACSRAYKQKAKIMNDKPDARGRLMLAALHETEVKRKNREAWEHRNTERGKSAAAVARKIKQEVRRVNRDVWTEWRERREFARTLAKRGKYVLPAPFREAGPALSCVACGTRQDATAFARNSHVCKTCEPQVQGLAQALAELHAARARAKQKKSLWQKTLNVAGTARAELAPRRRQSVDAKGHV